jgi:hypothetical protein
MKVVFFLVDGFVVVFFIVDFGTLFKTGAGYFDTFKFVGEAGVETFDLPDASFDDDVDFVDMGVGTDVDADDAFFFLLPDLSMIAASTFD